MINKINKLKAILGIATLLSSSILLSMTSEQRRELITTKKSLEKLMQQSPATMSEAEYRTWENETNEAINKLRQLSPALANKYALQKEEKIGDKRKIPPAGPPTQISEGKNEELMEQYRKILLKTADELPKLYKPALKEIDTFREKVELASAAGGGITQEQAEELYGLIRDLITRITSAVIKQVTKEVDIIAKSIHVTAMAFKEGETQKDKFLTDPEERKDVEDGFNQILALLSSTAEYSNKILQTQKYVDAADEKYKKPLKDSINKLWLEITSMESQFSSYISEVFIKNPAKTGASDYNKERMSVLLAITQTMPIVGKIGIKFIGTFDKTTIPWIEDTKSETSKLMEELYKAFEDAYPQ